MDISILYGIQDIFAHPTLDAFFVYFTWLGEAGVLWVAIGICMLFSRKWRFWGICLLMALLAVFLLNEIGLKNLIGRIRPYIEHSFNTIHIFPPTSYSFPSGHAGCAFAAATVIALSPAKRPWKILVWIVAILLAFSRLYLFVHYPTDVLVGAILGTLYAFIVVKIGLAVHNKRQEKPVHGKHAAL